MRRLRKTGAVDQDGNVVTIPRLPSVAGSNKPPGWNRWSDAERVEHLLGMSLDRLHDYLSWPPIASIHSDLQRRRRSSASLRWSRPRPVPKLPAGANGSVFLPRWRGISGIATRHRPWYGENPVAQGEVREIAVRLGNCGDFLGNRGRHDMVLDLRSLAG
jgi:hypothetical protein